MLQTLIRSISALVIAMALIGTVQADIVGKDVTYTVDGEPYQGYFARNTALGGNQPVVLIIHDWNGLDAYEKRRARMLARQGYAAFAADLYGKGIRPDTTEEMKARSGELYRDRAEMLRRVQGAVAQLAELDGVDSERVVAAGYCFGGSAVLELARAGAALDGFVTFHGGLATPEGEGYSRVKAPMLILHGSADTAVPMSVVAELAAALDEAGVDHRMEIYGGAPHAFTVWSGERYRAEADLASWDEFMGFLDERF